MANEKENGGGPPAGDRPGIEARRRRRGSSWRIAGWGIAALLLLLPLVAMRFTADVNWTASDFIFVGVLIGSVGVGFEAAVRMTASIAYRAAAGVAVAAAFLTVWVNGAVGMIGSEDNVFNLLFGGVLVLALAGAIVAWFRPAGMARVMVMAAIAQGAVSAVGLSTDLRGGVLSMGFAGLWLLSAALFWKAARDQTSAGASTPTTAP